MSIPDVEFSAAIQENKDVMYAITSPVSQRSNGQSRSDSQEERISILKSVLAQKGVPFNSHYDLAAPEQDSTPARPIVEETHDDDDTGGIHL